MIGETITIINNIINTPPISIIAKQSTETAMFIAILSSMGVFATLLIFQARRSKEKMEFKRKVFVLKNELEAELTYNLEKLSHGNPSWDECITDTFEIIRKEILLYSILNFKRDLVKDTRDVYTNIISMKYSHTKPRIPVKDLCEIIRKLLVDFKKLKIMTF